MARHHCVRYTFSNTVLHSWETAGVRRYLFLFLFFQYECLNMQYAFLSLRYTFPTTTISTHHLSSTLPRLRRLVHNGSKPDGTPTTRLRHGRLDNIDLGCAAVCTWRGAILSIGSRGFAGQRQFGNSMLSGMLCTYTVSCLIVNLSFFSSGDVVFHPTKLRRRILPRLRYYAISICPFHSLQSDKYT